MRNFDFYKPINFLIKSGKINYKILIIWIKIFLKIEIISKKFKIPDFIKSGKICRQTKT